MYVNSSPAESAKDVPTLTDILGPSMGWQSMATPANVSASMVAEQDKRAGERLFALRDQKGWSREELAFRAKVSAKTVERIENGKVEGRRGTIRSIAEALEVDEFAILGERPNLLGIPLSDQVDGGFIEFREHVAALHKRLANIEATLQRFDADGEIEKQLKMQTGLLKDIQEVVAVLKDVKGVISAPAKAKARSGEPTPETHHVPKAPKGRRPKLPKPKPARRIA